MSSASLSRSVLPTQLARFAVVGVSNTAVTLISYTLLALALPAVAAAALSWGIGAANGYVLNRTWTFASRVHGARPVARYGVVQALCAGVNAMVVWMMRGDPKLAAELVALPLASLLGFALCRRWVFGA
jgi:putative flippase GtrA